MASILRLLPACGFCLAGLGFFGLRLWLGTSLLGFADEDLHVLGAKVIASGGRLYRDFVDIHGPLIFILSQLYGAVFSWSWPNGARLCGAFLMAAGLLAIVCGPGLSGLRPRLWCGGLLGVWLAAVWLRQGLNLLDYYAPAGALAALFLGTYGLGAWRGAQIARSPAFIAGLALAALGAASYAYGFSIVFLALSAGIGSWRAGQRQTIRFFVAGMAAGGLLLLAWLLRFGDLRGYLAYHVLESLLYYSRYTALSPHTFLQSLVPDLAPVRRIQTLAVAASLVSLALHLWLDASRPRRHVPEILLGHLAVLALNARGLTIFQDGSFVIGALCVAAPAVAEAIARAAAVSRRVGTALAALAAFAVLAFAHPALVTPFGITQAALARTRGSVFGRPSDAPLFQRIRALTHSKQPILVLVYDPGLYLAADRPPMTGFYTYFAYDADYAKSPWFSRGHDLCSAIAESPPLVIVYDHTPVWGFALEHYAPCVLDLMAHDYIADLVQGPNGTTLYRLRVPR